MTAALNSHSACAEASVHWDSLVLTNSNWWATSSRSHHGAGRWDSETLTLDRWAAALMGYKSPQGVPASISAPDLTTQAWMARTSPRIQRSGVQHGIGAGFID